MTATPVSITATDTPGQPPPSAELDELYRGFERELLLPLWTDIGDMMPTEQLTDMSTPDRSRGERL